MLIHHSSAYDPDDFHTYFEIFYNQAPRYFDITDEPDGSIANLSLKDSLIDEHLDELIQALHECEFIDCPEDWYDIFRVIDRFNEMVSEIYDDIDHWKYGATIINILAKHLHIED